MAIWKGTKGHNYWTGRAGYQAIAIVNHIMQGSMESTFSWFSNPKAKASAHFGVAKNGEIWMFVDPMNTAWANGIVNDPDTSIKWLADAIEKGINPNYLTLSIEHEGNSGDPMPASQFHSTLDLHRSLITAYGIDPEPDYIIRHSQIDSVNRPNCPGPSFPMERLLKELSVMSKQGICDFVDPVTGFPVIGMFADFYEEKGGLSIFGRPISTQQGTTSTKRIYGDAVAVQWFERARFELQPNGSVLLGLVGRESYNAGY